MTRRTRHFAADNSVSVMTANRLVPVLPPGRHVELDGRGTTYARCGGRDGAPAVLLLHGWTASADLNWRPAYDALTSAYRVIAPDHHGHGRGLRSRRQFTLEACADDAAALIGELGIERVVAVGYSMGGPIAKLLWRRHPHLVDGLVLCATSRTFNDSPREHAMFRAVAAAAATARRLPPAQVAVLARKLLNHRHLDRSALTAAAETFAMHDWVAVIEAARELGRFDSRPWAPQIDVPSSVVVTTSDRVVPTWRQYQLAAAIPGATMHRVDGDHASCLALADQFVPRLMDAIDSVVTRAHRRPALAA